MEIKFDRSSFCAADDCVSHIEKKKLPSEMPISELLKYTATYVPLRKNSVWRITSMSNVSIVVLGYLITDNEGNTTNIELSVEETTMKNLSVKDVYCSYFSESRFTYRNGKSGELVEEYKECGSLLEKVKRSYESFN
jgi:hypothetical protein